ncbi:15097_t:CDS:10 [Entrophospora sp. SA101]|nr:15097_t:CDS:10 [Entrophospora sp. SA101]
MSTDNHNNDGFPFIPVARDSGSHDSHLLDIQDNNNSQTPSSPIGGGGKGGKPRSQRSSSRNKKKGPKKQRVTYKSSTTPSINVVEETENNDDNGDRNEEGSGDESDREYTLKERQDKINYTHPFGLPLWKPALYKKSRSVIRNANEALHSAPSSDLYLRPGNILWAILCGWWLALISLVLSFTLSMMPFGGSQYARVLRELSCYILWPFDKYVEIIEDEFLEEDDGHDYATFENDDGINSSESDINFDVGGGRHRHRDNEAAAGERRPLLPHTPSFIEVRRKNREKKNLFNKVGEMGPAGLVFCFLFYLVIAPLFLLVSALCWLAVIPIPMAKLTYILTRHLRRHPLSLNFKSGSTTSSYHSLILLCTHDAIGFQYYKYTFEGINIIFINLIPLVFFAIIDDYILHEVLNLDYFFTDPKFIFSISLASVIPLSYFIGMAVASISAQSSAGMGAVINATFGSIIEIILYAMALIRGKGKLTEGSIIGSLMAGVLLMPGVSMVSGAFKRKEQRFNAKSAGVTSTMLIMAIIGALTPTLFYQTYAPYYMDCRPCTENDQFGDCQRCVHLQVDPITTPLYKNKSYLIGLWFTLRTHAALVWQTGHHHTFADQNTQNNRISLYKKITNTLMHSLPIYNTHPQQHQQHQQQLQQHQHQPPTLHHRPMSAFDAGHHHHHLSPENINIAQVAANLDQLRFAYDPEEEEEPVGHDSPNWSKLKSGIVLVICTILYSAIAEILVSNVEVVLKKDPDDKISHGYEKLVGLTLFALVPNVTEFVNAMAFALYGNIALSMEIGSAYALQVCLLQIPAMVAFSGWYNHGIGDEEQKGHTFTAKALPSNKYLLDLKIFLTRSTTTPSSIFFQGRPNFDVILSDVKTYHGSGDIAVGVCGPGPMRTQVRNAAVAQSDETCLFKVHYETFEL